DFKGQAFSRFLDRLNARWLRLSAKVASGAIMHARLRQADRVFCGHTHQAQSCERGGVAYYNSGSWTDFPPTYVIIDSGGVQIHEYHEPSEVSSRFDVEAEASFARAWRCETPLPAGGGPASAAESSYGSR